MPYIPPFRRYRGDHVTERLSWSERNPGLAVMWFFIVPCVVGFLLLLIFVSLVGR